MRGRKALLTNAARRGDVLRGSYPRSPISIRRKYSTTGNYVVAKITTREGARFQAPGASRSERRPERRSRPGLPYSWYLAPATWHLRSFPQCYERINPRRSASGTVRGKAADCQEQAPDGDIRHRICRADPKQEPGNHLRCAEGQRHTNRQARQRDHQALAEDHAADRRRLTS